MLEFSKVEPAPLRAGGDVTQRTLSRDAIASSTVFVSLFIRLSFFRVDSQPPIAIVLFPQLAMAGRRRRCGHTPPRTRAQVSLILRLIYAQP